MQCKQRHVGFKYPRLHDIAYRIAREDGDWAISCRPQLILVSWHGVIWWYCPTIERMAGREGGFPGGSGWQRRVVRAGV